MEKLEMIDVRLELLKKYLEYRTDMWYQTPFGRIHFLKTMGILWVGSDTLSFDEWLEFQKATNYIF